MKITVRLHATLRKYLPNAADGTAVVEVPDGATVAGLLTQLRIPEGHARMFVSGDDHLDPASVLRDGQELNIFPPIAGGAA